MHTKSNSNLAEGTSVVDNVRVLNQDQKVNYMLTRESKYKLTDTLNLKSEAAFQKLFQNMKPLKKEYMSNAQSNLIWSEREHSGKRAINHQSTSYDIFSQAPQKQHNSKPSMGQPSQVFAKVNGISEYAQATRLTSPNYNKDYQKALGQNEGLFKRGKGMCAEYANRAVTHNFICTPFGRK